MDILVLNEEGAEALRGRHGVYSALDPVATPDGKFMIPKRCLVDPDLASAVADMNTHTEEENQILDLPELGEECVAGVLYKYSDETGTIDDNQSGNVKCVQTHNRTEHPPYTIPALFSFFRENTDDLDWIPNEYVSLDWMRMYEGTQYRVIQAHMTLSTWTPDVTPALWEVVAGEVVVSVFVQPTGAHDAYAIGDQVYFPTEADSIYESLISANTYSPTAYPAGWLLIS